MKKKVSFQRALIEYGVPVFALLLLFSVASIIVPIQKTNAAGDISGTVFLDYNSNGTRDVSGVSPNYAVDKGVSGITVTVFDSSGIARGSDVSDANGNYTVSATGTGPYRVEFSNLPSGYMPGSVGSSNGSSVRFVSDGNSSGVDFGIITLKDYCQNAPELVTTCFAGTVGGNSSATVLVSFPYESGTTSRTSSATVTDPTSHSLMVPQNDLGAIWGLAYHRRSQKIFASAFTKRHAGFRNDNQGTASNDPTGEIFISNTTGMSGSLFVNLNTLFGSNIAGDNPHEITNYETDTGAFDGVGTTGFGDIDLSEDEQTLYAVNLYDRNLYAIPLGSGTPAAPTSSSQVTVYDLASLTNPGTGSTGCAWDPATPAGEMNLNLRPGALKVDGDNIYVGLTCTAQSTGNTNDLRAFVYDLNPAGSGSATQVANFALDYPRGCVSNNGTVCAPAAWQPWADDVSDLLDYAPWGQKYLPQPWLVDIEFDQNGFMILGFGDRTGHQTGNDNSGANTGTVEGVAAGDTLRLNKNGASWTLESNGSDGTNTTGGSGTGDGPGNGEFYFEDGYTISSNVHSEVGLGGLLNVPGFQDVVVSAFDPAPTNQLPGGENTYRAGGLIYLNNNDGTRSRSYQLFSIDQPNTFGKASGIGDLEAICENAPLQVGNRVWNDTDGDGIQDPGEAALANVDLEIWADTTGDGNVDANVGTVTTDSNGNYVFGGPSDSNLSYTCGSTPGTVDVRVNSSTDDAEQRLSNGNVTTNSGDLDMFENNGSGTEYSYVGVRFTNVTIPVGATITNAYIEFRANNNSTVSGGNPTFTIHAESSTNPSTYSSTQNDLSPSSRPRTSQSVSWSPSTWSDSSTEQTSNLAAIVQEVVETTGWANGRPMSFILSGPVGAAYREAESFDGNSGRAPRLVVQYTVPLNCKYSLLPFTAYEVRVSQSNFNSGNALENYFPTAANADSSPNGDSRDSDGLVFAGNEIKVPFTTGNHGENDFKFDFGFLAGGGGAPIYSIGNRVWFDTDDDGIIDPGESGISGVSVSVLLDSDSNGVPDTPGSPLQTITTDANGYYRFDSLQANNYVVRIDPSNFGPSAILEGYRNTTGTNTADADSSGASSNAENGVSPTSAPDVLTDGLFSNSINLAPASEPTSEPDVPTSGPYAGQGSLDQFADMTVDFGFFGLSLSGTVWDDRGPGAETNNGILDSGETLLSGIVVKLYDSTGTEVPVGPDGILGTADDANGGVTTDASGNYRFECLAAGDYRVVIEPSGGSSSDPTESNPNLNFDFNDNGFPDNTGSYPGDLISGMVTLTPGYTGAQGNNVVNMAAGHTSDPTVDFGIMLAPLQVKLDRFEAYYKGDRVFLEWNTGGETDNLGFNVYRSNGGGSSLLTESPIAGSALRTAVNMKVTGNEYSWSDRDPSQDASYYLEDIDLDGTRTLHGPIRPKMDFSYRAPRAESVLLTGMGNVNRFRKREYLSDQGPVHSLAEDTNGNNPAVSGAGVKIFVRDSGRYRVTISELAASGFDVNTNPDNWRMFEGGREVPIAVGTSGGLTPGIEFIANGFESKFADEQVFYLVSGETRGQRLATYGEKSAEGQSKSGSFRVTTVRKDRTIYASSILNAEKENWFGAPVLSSQDAVLEIRTANPDLNSAREARLRVKLQGLSSQQHLVNIKFNGEVLGTVDYFGQENREFEFMLPMSSLSGEINSVELRASGGPEDVSLVDEISIRYSKKFIADEGALRFAVEAGQSAFITGFDSSDLDVYELDNDGRAIGKALVNVKSEGGSFGFSIRAFGNSREFVAYERSAGPAVLRIERDTHSDLRSSDNMADLVIVAPSRFMKPASQLAEIRSEQGFATIVVSVEDIYDEYSFGRKSDLAIRGFFRDALKSWKLAPEYAILFGDASYDMRDYLGQGMRDIIPTRLFDSETMETASDSWFVDFDGDGIEDIATGRLPAATYEEAVNMVEKLERYDRQGARIKRVNLLIADDGYEETNARLAVLAGREVESITLDRSQLSDGELRDRIFENMNENAMVVTYTGHGSSGIWGGYNIFNQNDPGTLTNNRLSFAMALSCLNGLFHNASSDSLAERLFKAENGSAAVWSSTGSTYSSNQITMGETVIENIFGGKYRIGDLTRAAKRSTSSVDARMTWQLIGDPTTVIK